MERCVEVCPYGKVFSGVSFIEGVLYVEVLLKLLRILQISLCLILLP